MSCVLCLASVQWLSGGFLENCNTYYISACLRQIIVVLSSLPIVKSHLEKKDNILKTGQFFKIFVY